MLPIQSASTATQGGYSLWSWILIGAMFVLMLFVLSRSGKKRVAQMEQQREALRKQLEPGVWVRTTAGFYGKVVEVTGEVVTLENLTGDETLWDVRAIAEVREPSFGALGEENTSTQPGAKTQNEDSPESEAADLDGDLTTEEDKDSGFGKNV